MKKLINLPKLKTPLNKRIELPFENGKLIIEYDKSVYTPSAHSSILQIYNFTINKSDKLAAIIGAGSGIDTIAVAKKGRVHVVAIDIDPYALAVTKYNSQLNKVDNQIHLELGNMLGPLDKYINK